MFPTETAFHYNFKHLIVTVWHFQLLDVTNLSWNWTEIKYLFSDGEKMRVDVTGLNWQQTHADVNDGDQASLC